MVHDSGLIRFIAANAVRFACTKSCTGNRPNILFCMRSSIIFLLLTYFVANDDFIIMKFYDDSTNDNHKHAA